MRRLVEAAQRDRDAFNLHFKDAGCACHTHPPCGFCTHPGNPVNQEENETAWEVVYSKDEALWWAINQMRRAARVLDIASIMIPEDRSYSEIYGKGLDMCADECEKVIDPEELKRMKHETYPDYCPTCGRAGAARQENESGGVDICYDDWHKEVTA